MKASHYTLMAPFYGKDRENPLQHVRDFEFLLGSIATPAQLDMARLTLFPHSLRDKAKAWFQSLEPQSLRTWQEVLDIFLAKYFPASKRYLLVGQIQSFKQKDGESLYQSWERFKDLLMDVPHHGFDKYQLVTYFYNGCSMESRKMIDMMCNGRLEDKTPQEAWEHLSFMAEQDRGWNNLDPGERAMLNQGPSGSGKFRLDEPVDLHHRVDELTRKLESMQVKQVNAHVAAVKVEDVCSICEYAGHPSSECPTLPALKEIYNNVHQHADVNAIQRHDPFSNTYNPGWAKNPAFGWRDNQGVGSSQGQQQQQQQQYSRPPQGQGQYSQGQGQQRFQQQGPPGFAPQGAQGMNPYPPT